MVCFCQRSYHALLMPADITCSATSHSMFCVCLQTYQDQLLPAGIPCSEEKITSCFCQKTYHGLLLPADISCFVRRHTMLCSDILCSRHTVLCDATWRRSNSLRLITRSHTYILYAADIQCHEEQ